MVSVLRTLQADWNALVPSAQALGIRRVRALNAPLETIEYRRNKLEWLRAEISRLQGSTILTSPTAEAAQTALPPFTFGVELELIMPRGTNHYGLAYAISRAGVACASEGYNHTTGSNWKVVTDGSLGDYARGAEVVSPVLEGEAGLAALRKVCDAVKAAGCKISKKCGLHVHVGARNFAFGTFKNLAMLYASAERHIDAFMAPSRRGAQGGNGFCRSVRIAAHLMERADTIDAVARACHQSPGRESARGSGRYCKLNFQSFWQHGTVEFRHHQGTVEADKAINWTRFCLRMCQAAQNGVRGADGFDGLFTALAAPDAERDFFRGRREFFERQEQRNVQRTERARERRDTSFRAAWSAPPPPCPETSPFETAGNDMERRALTRGQV